MVAITIIFLILAVSFYYIYKSKTQDLFTLLTNKNQFEFESNDKLQQLLQNGTIQVRYPKNIYGKFLPENKVVIYCKRKDRLYVLNTIDPETFPMSLTDNK
jgi:hypothetical protein